MAKKAMSDGQYGGTEQSSPYATGGGGVRFEHRVGALCLARLLSGAVMSELDERAPTHVAFQQAPISAVDDVVLSVNARSGSPAICLAKDCSYRIHLDEFVALFAPTIRELSVWN